MTAGVAVLAFAACGGGSKPAQKPAEPIANTAPAAEPAVAPPAPPQTQNQRAMAKMREFETAMCACKDSPCANQVSQDMTKWAQAEATTSREPIQMSDEEVQEATKIGTHMGECMMSAMNAGSGATP
jgi:hypothetical protein